MPKKLIEVALPLEAINAASAREKSIRHGHPSTLHLWWARRPLAACRAVLFAQMVDDPSGHPELFPTEEAQAAERQRLFRLIEELVKWENSNNEPLLAEAHAEIVKYAPNGTPPPVLDPFAGGGSIPLEAQRLGLEAHASDLNPVAVLINKALIEIPPRFAGMPPVNPTRRGGPPWPPATPHLATGQARGPVPTVLLTGDDWKGAAGLAADVRYYGRWMRDEAEQRIGHLYPKVDVRSSELGVRSSDATPPLTHNSKLLTPIAWLWARTVTCPNPACRARMPLVRSFELSTKAGKEAWVQPVIDRSQQPPRVRFTVQTGGRGGPPRPPEGTVNRRGATCLVCDSPVPFPHVRSEGQAGRMGAQLMAIVAEGDRQRVYLAPDEEQVRIADSAQPTWKPNAKLPVNPRDFKTPNYGMTTFADLFTPRQLAALTTFSDLVGEARPRVLADALAAGLAEARAASYADAVATYLAFAVDRSADFWCTIATWSPQPKNEIVSHAFTRQAIPMTWDFAEANPFSESGGNFEGNLGFTAKVIERSVDGAIVGHSVQRDATAIAGHSEIVISTDPPYYDNIGYADLSDFFYVWLRRSLDTQYPELFRTLLVPKAEELIAAPYRFNGSSDKAQQFFEDGLLRAFARMGEAAHRSYPITVYYAFKQSENDISGTASTGWETMLEGLIRTGFQITGTWPIRTERSARSISIGTNALASSVVLVCRVRAEDAPLATRREFVAALQRELPPALRNLQRGNVAPVDLAQAAIGPGMAIYSRYRRVLEADGASLRVRAALALINRSLDEYFSEQEGEFDPDTRWALAWFEQYAFDEAEYGIAETLSKAKNTSVQGMVGAGILHARAGKVRLLRRDELPAGWQPDNDSRLTVWEATQHLIRTLQEQGEVRAADLLARLGILGAPARDLAYRLYTICERKGWAQEALPYNALVVAWSDVGRLAGAAARRDPVQERML